MSPISRLEGGSALLKDSLPPLVSIITVCYNAAPTLSRTIASLEAQSDQRFEYIIVDGGSEDETREILKTHDASIHAWLSEPDAGIYDAMNKGAKMASGNYIAFLNADDRYGPDTIKILIETMAHSHADVYHGNMTKERIIDGKVYTRLEKPNPELMPSGMGIFHPSSFVKTSLFREMGGYDTRYKLAADYDFFLRLWLSGAKFHHIDASLSIFSLEGASNASCGTYAEAVLIQKRLGTGTHRHTRMLQHKCQIKQLLRQAAFRAAKVLNLSHLLEVKQAARWK